MSRKVWSAQRLPPAEPPSRVHLGHCLRPCSVCVSLQGEQKPVHAPLEPAARLPGVETSPGSRISWASAASKNPRKQAADSFHGAAGTSLEMLQWRRPVPLLRTGGTGQTLPPQARDRAARRPAKATGAFSWVGGRQPAGRDRGVIASEPAPPIIERTGWAGRRCRHPRGEW
jgi:hypothetical protein